MNPIYKFEKYHLALLESGGIAAIDYSRNMEIILFILSNFPKHKLKRIIDINNIPELKNNKIKWAKQVNIIINYDPRKDNEIYAIYKPELTVIRDNIVESITIEIYIYNNIPTNIYALRRFLYHEFTHCHEDIERRLSGNDSISNVYFNKHKIKYQELTMYLLTESPEKDMAKYELLNLMYRLYIETERNALSNELYADLISLRNLGYNINKQTIKTYIFNQTESGQDYLYFKDLLTQLKTSNVWVTKIIDYFNDNFLDKFKNLTQFKKWFILFGENSLSILFKQLCKIGETFLIHESADYDKIDELSNKLTESINNILDEYTKYTDPLNVYENYTIPYIEYSVYNKPHKQSLIINITVNNIKLKLL